MDCSERSYAGYSYFHRTMNHSTAEQRVAADLLDRAILAAGSSKYTFPIIKGVQLVQLN